MANDNLVLNLLIKADPANRGSIADLLALQNVFDRIAKESPGILNLAKSLKITYQEADALSKQVGLTDKAIVGAANTMRALSKAGADTVTQFVALKSVLNPEQFTAINAAINKSVTDFSNNSKSQAALAQTLGTSIGNAEKFAGAIGLSAEKANSAVNRYNELSNVGATLAQKQTVLSQELGITAQQFEVVRGAAIGSQQGLTAILGVTSAVVFGLGDIAKRSITVAADFDASLRQFGVISGASAEQVSTLRDNVERLGTSTTKTPKEIAQLSIELSKAGFTALQTQQSLDGIVFASQATGENLVQTGQLIGNVINQFKLSATNTGEIGDLLVATANSSASGVTDLGQALSYAGTQSEQSNQSLKGTLLSLGLLANAGIKGSAAGTGLSEVLRRLKLASANAGTEFDDLRSRGSKLAVVAFDKINTSVRDATGQMKPLNEILPQIKNNISSLKQGDQDLVMSALFGVQGGKIANTLLAGNVTQIESLTNALNTAEGVSKRSSESLTQGATAGFQILTANTEVALASVGDLLLLGVTPLVSAANTLVAGFSALPAPLQAIIVGVAGFTAALAAATAILAAYNLAQGTMIIQETLAAFATIRTTGVRLAAIGTEKIATISKAALALANSTLTAGTIAASLATARDTVQRGLNAAITSVSTGSLKANSVALLANVVAVRAALVAYLGIAVVIGGVVALFQDLTNVSAADKFNTAVQKSTGEILKLKGEVQAPPKDDLFKSLGDSFNRFTGNVQNKGAIEALRAVFIDLDAAVLGGSDSLSRYGDDWRFVTNEQLANQAAQSNLENQFKVVNGTIDQSRALMDKYGVAVLDAGDKQRLGAAGIAAFNAESAQLIATIEGTIAILQKQKGAATNDGQKLQIQNEIELLELSKVALQKRSAGLTDNTQALKTNTDAGREAAKVQAEIKKISESISGGDKSSDAGVAELQALEKNTALSLKNRKSASVAIVKIRRDEISEINTAVSDGEITEAEGIAKLQALRAKSGDNKAVIKASSDAIVKIRKDEISAISAAIEVGEINEAQGIARLQALRASSGDDKVSTKAASDAILKIRKEQNDAEISIIQSGQAAIEVLISAGKLSEVEGDKQLTALKIAEVNKRIAGIKLEIAESSGSKRSKLVAEEQKLNSEIEKIQIAAIQREQKRRIDAIDKAAKEALELTVRSEALRLIAIQQSVNSEVLTVEQANKLRAESSTQRLKDELAANADQATKLAALPNPSDPALLKEVEGKRSTIKQQGLDLTLKLLQAEAAAVELVRSETIKAIDNELAARNRLFDRELKNITVIINARNRQTVAASASADKEIAAYDRTVKLAGKQNELLTAQVNLRRAIADSTNAAAEISLGLINQELQAQPDNIALLQTKAEIESRIALERRSQLIQEQTAAAAALTLTQQQVSIGDKRLLIEAKIAEIKAKAALLDAQALVNQQRILDAQAIGIANADLGKARALAPGADRQQAIAEADSKLNLAQISARESQANAVQQVDLARQGVDLAQANTVEVTNAIASNTQILSLQRETLSIEQQTALIRFDATEELRAQSEQLNINRAIQADITRLATEETNARNPQGQTPKPIAAFRDGGTPPINQPFTAGEGGPELIQSATGIKLIDTPGVYSVDRPSRIYNAADTAQLLNGDRLKINFPNTGHPGLLAEIKGLRQDLSRGAAITNNSFSIVADEDPYKRISTILAGLQRGRR